MEPPAKGPTAVPTVTVRLPADLVERAVRCGPHFGQHEKAASVRTALARGVAELERYVAQCSAAPAQEPAE